MPHLTHLDWQLSKYYLALAKNNCIDNSLLFRSILSHLTNFSFYKRKIAFFWFIGMFWDSSTNQKCYSAQVVNTLRVFRKQ